LLITFDFLHTSQIPHINQNTVLLLKRYLSYLHNATDEHGVHSPFVFRLYCDVIRRKKARYFQLIRVAPGDKLDFSERNQAEISATKAIETLRNKLLQDNRKITITDFGAGSRIYKGNERLIRQIAKSAEKSPAFGQLLFRLIHHFQAKTIFDLGTSLGMTTLYQAKGNPDAQVVSFEGCEATATIAQQNFDELACSNIRLVTGNLDHTLQEELQKITRLDFAFFDANHRYQPTVDYFEQCLEKAHEDSIFVFDDIHWSDEMQAAWQYIQTHSEVSVTIDLFYVGIVFFRKKQTKQHFVLKF
jgi:predicted O-methyltransferase YrrM